MLYTHLAARSVLPHSDPLMLELLGIMMRSQHTVVAIAAGSGVSTATLSRWGDKTRHPRIDTMAKVARFLGYQIVIVRNEAHLQ